MSTNVNAVAGLSEGTSRYFSVHELLLEKTDKTKSDSFKKRDPSKEIIVEINTEGSGTVVGTNKSTTINAKATKEDIMNAQKIMEDAITELNSKIKALNTNVSASKIDEVDTSVKKLEDAVKSMTDVLNSSDNMNTTPDMITLKDTVKQRITDANSLIGTSKEYKDGAQKRINNAKKPGAVAEEKTEMNGGRRRTKRNKKQLRKSRKSK